MFETLSKRELDAMTSDAYKENFQGVNGEDFRKRVSELENQPHQAARPAGNVRGPEPVATPASTSYDPSFDDEPAPAAAPVPAAAQPAAQTMPRDKMSVWEYQPVDSNGRPLGGLQRFKYDPTLPNEDPNSLASQLTKSNMHAVRMAKERKVADVIDSVKQVGTGYREPTLLTMDQHPEYAALNEITLNTVANAVNSAMNVFKQNHPEFPRGEANATAMVRWVEKSGRSPADAQTWESAWTALKPHLLGESMPAVEVVTAPAPVLEQPKAAASTPRRTAAIPTGISNLDETSTNEPVVAPVVQGVKLVIDNKVTVLDLRGWDRLPSDTQKRVLRNPANASAIDALYRAQEERKQGRR